ncbi:MAG: BON domain-containing protein [Bradyrhizobium sp.]|nr:MAG: BON domain-containing protein [Bradyrhizobium sp.]
MTEQSRDRLGAAVAERWTAMQGGFIATSQDEEHRGRPPRQDDNTPDARRERIAAEARNAIFWDLTVPRDRVSVRCDQGWVTLSGSVERAYQRSAAEADVRRVPGVVGVTNAITVTEKASDKSVAAA